MHTNISLTSVDAIFGEEHNDWHHEFQRKTLANYLPCKKHTSFDRNRKYLISCFFRLKSNSLNIDNYWNYASKKTSEL